MQKATWEFDHGSILYISWLCYWELEFRQGCRGLKVFGLMIIWSSERLSTQNNIRHTPISPLHMISPTYNRSSARPRRWKISKVQFTLFSDCALDSNHSHYQQYPWLSSHRLPQFHVCLFAWSAAYNVVACCEWNQLPPRSPLHNCRTSISMFTHSHVPSSQSFSTNPKITSPIPSLVVIFHHENSIAISENHMLHKLPIRSLLAKWMNRRGRLCYDLSSGYLNSFTQYDLPKVLIIRQTPPQLHRPIFSTLLTLKHEMKIVMIGNFRCFCVNILEFSIHAVMICDSIDGWWWSIRRCQAVSSRPWGALVRTPDGFDVLGYACLLWTDIAFDWDLDCIVLECGLWGFRNLCTCVGVVNCGCDGRLYVWDILDCLAWT